MLLVKKTSAFYGHQTVDFQRDSVRLISEQPNQRQGCLIGTASLSRQSDPLRVTLHSVSTRLVMYINSLRVNRPLHVNNIVQ
jgi:hypothetical protein